MKNIKCLDAFSIENGDFHCHVSLTEGKSTCFLSNQWKETPRTPNNGTPIPYYSPTTSIRIWSMGIVWEWELGSHSWGPLGKSLTKVTSGLALKLQAPFHRKLTVLEWPMETKILGWSLPNNDHGVPGDPNLWCREFWPVKRFTWRASGIKLSVSVRVLTA